MNDKLQAADGNAAQIEFWNQVAAEKWIRYEEQLDCGLDAAKDRLLKRAGISPGQQIVEIGSGTGATTMALAKQTGDKGSVLAIDVSRPLVDRARERARLARLNNITFLLADAQTLKFEPASADLIASRFGVMFFADPVAAFTNIAKALRPGGRMAFVSWARVEVNPWFHIPRDAAVARLGEPAPAPPDAPGPLAFRNIGNVQDILARAGLTDIRADEEPIELVFPGTPAQIAELASNLGPASRIIKEKSGSPQDVAEIARQVEIHLAGMAVPGSVNVPAHLNFFNATKP